MNKRKIDLEKILLEQNKEHNNNQEKQIGDKVNEHGLYFLKENEEKQYPDANEIEIFGKKIYVIMKEKLVGALFDPSSDDLETLRKARNYASNKLKKIFSKTKLNPEMSNFKATLDDKYTSSLVMNLIEYPSDKPYIENIKEIGFENPEIKKYYVQVASAWLGSPIDIDFGGMMGKVDKISTWKGSAETIDLFVEQCEKGSHYVLKLDVKKMQDQVQKQAIEITKEYGEIEEQIVNYIKQNATNYKMANNAENMVRMFLNLSVLYDKGKPLPLK